MVLHVNVIVIGVYRNEKCVPKFFPNAANMVPLPHGRKNGMRNIYSNYNQMRAYVECSPNQSKNYTLLTFPLSNQRSFLGIRNSAGRFYISILPEYCSSALTAQAYKMVITTVCVQIDNCFCNI